MTNFLPKILLIGSEGQLGQAIRAHALAQPFEWIVSNREQLNLNDKTSIQTAIQTFKPDIVLNAAAYTAVDQAEAEKDLAMQINYLGVMHLAQYCSEKNLPLIHISTDYVFDGKKNTPYTEEEIANPLNIYGYSKLLGENSIRQYCEKHLIVRVSGIVSEYRHNFLKTILRLSKEKEELRIVADQITCPTNASDIAYAVLTIMSHLKNWGTYHFCSQEPTSWYAFAKAIIHQAQHKAELKVKTIHAIKSSEYQTAAKRPLYSALNCNKIKKDYGLSQPRWEMGIQSILENLEI